VDQHPARDEDASNVVPLRVAGELPLPLEQLVEQAFRIALGLVTISADALADAVAQTLGGSGPRPDEPAQGARPSLPLLAGAAIGVAVGAARWSARAATTLVRTGEIIVSPVTSSVPFRDGMRQLGAELDVLDALWRSERPRDEQAAEAFVRLLVPQVVDAALDQVDIDRIVAERVDVERVVDRVDLDVVVARIDLDEIVARVDLERVVDRIDVDAVAAKLDVEAVVRRLDLAAIASEVVDELDLPEIIRESMGSMTTETVGGIRVQSMNADRAISRLVDRVLQRHAHDDQDRPEDPV